MSRPFSRDTFEAVYDQMKERLSAQVGSRSMSHIDKEFTPIIKELASLKLGNDQHPSAKTIYNWLIDPQCTAEDFSYVIGPLERHVYITLLNNPWGMCTYLGKIAAEALAVRCPILEGPWETVAWFVLRLTNRYMMRLSYNKYMTFCPRNSNNHGYASAQLNNWIIYVIGDINICPCPCLRFELMHLLFVMVDLNSQNQKQAFESVFSAINSLNFDYFTVKLNNEYFIRSRRNDKFGFFNMDINKTIQVIHRFSTPELDNCIFKFDVKLADELNNIYNSQLSIRICGFTSKHSVNPNRCTEPTYLKTLYSLLNTCKDNINFELNLLQEHIDDGHWKNLEFLTNSVIILFKSFIRSFATAQLITPAASCAVDLIELVVLGLRKSRGIFLSFHDIEELLEKLFDDKSAKSPLGRKILGFKERLQNAKEKFQSLHIDKFQLYYPKLYCLLNDGYIWHTDTDM